MPIIHLTTFIAAPAERVFDLSSSVDLHKYSMSSYGEQIIKGTMTGLMNKGEMVTWKARHLGKERLLTVRLTEWKRPDYFVDEQVEGDFALMKHEHYFKPVQNGTIMIDQFRFEIKYGWLGKLFNHFYLEKYLAGLLMQRNQSIRTTAEGNQWRQFLEK